jgi:hypothetical protein
VLYSFQDPPDGTAPLAGVIFNGENLFGTTSGGPGGAGCACDPGATVFKLTPPKTETDEWTEKILWTPVDEAAGHYLTAPLTFRHGAFYSTASDAGTWSTVCQFGCGTVFEVVP